jgi:Dehydrogenases with different specificities (related to short-chain alcohol dehydrogenases)
MNYIDELVNLKDRVAVLTGGGGVIAGKMADGLAQAGAIVVLLDLRLDNAQQKADEIIQAGGRAVAMVADVLDVNAMEQVKNAIIAQFGRVDILINAAGGNMPGATIGPDQTVFDLKIEDFKKVTDLNLNGSVIPSLVFGKVMAERGKGSIINLSSMAALQTLSRVAGYSASKAAITNFTAWLAHELASKFGEGIRVNALAPGFFIGDQNRALLINEDGSFTQRGQTVINKTPMGRFGEAHELVGATIFLCSDAARFITGIVLPVDGGFSSFSGV